MPRFYFSTDGGQHSFDDEDGTELPSADHVPREALMLLRELIDLRAPLRPQTIVATVCDATGAAVLRTSLSVAVERFNR